MSDAAELLAAARAAARQAYAPYSGYAVGAAVRSPDGRVFAGANVENASYGLTVCAERPAVFQAVLAGVRRIVAVAVWVEASAPAPPCGACLQVLAEFAPEPREVQVLLAGAGGEQVQGCLADWLPRPFRL